MTQANGIAIVVITHNSAEELPACLAAAVPAAPEVIVVDNASSDATLEVAARYPVRVIANRENRGFAAAANQGIHAAAWEYVLLLNPDATLTTPVEPLRRQCERPNAAAAAGMLTGPDGIPQRGFSIRRLPTPAALAFEALLLNRFWPRNQVNWRYRCMDFDYAKESRVEQPAGALLMIRKSAWERLGGFDEGFFPVWFEDVDFCRRVRNSGADVWYSPEVVARHAGGGSVRKIRPEMRHFYWYASLLRYTVKHFRPGAQRWVFVTVITGCLIRMIGVLFVRRSFQESCAFGRAAWLAARGLLLGSRTGIGVSPCM